MVHTEYINLEECLKILKKNNFDGVLIPDHTPQMTCDAPWYAGMAYAMGYMKALLSVLKEEEQSCKLLMLGCKQKKGEKKLNR